MNVKTTPAVNVEQLIARNRELITKLPKPESIYRKYWRTAK